MKLVEKYARSWPREFFDYVVSDAGKLVRHLAKELPILQQAGVYVLYRDDTPHYIGKTGKWLWNRLHVHARKPDNPYFNHWNFFSVFVIQDAEQRRIIEGILIAACPTAANSAKPALPHEPLPCKAGRMWLRKRDISPELTLPGVSEETEAEEE